VHDIGHEWGLRLGVEVFVLGPRSETENPLGYLDGLLVGRAGCSSAGPLQP